MQTVKALRRVIEPLQWVCSFSNGRSLSVLPNFSASNVDIVDQVCRVKRVYESWEENPGISYVLMKGSGKAFSSGADVLPLYHSINEGKA